jgi:hypothetical protein
LKSIASEESKAPKSRTLKLNVQENGFVETRIKNVGRPHADIIDQVA